MEERGRGEIEREREHTVSEGLGFRVYGLGFREVLDVMVWMFGAGSGGSSV